MVTSGSFMLIPQSLGRPVSREVGWEDALDPGGPSDYPPSRNDPEVITSGAPSAPVADDCRCCCSLSLTLILPLHQRFSAPERGHLTNFM
jgi:hypothetical protein